MSGRTPSSTLVPSLTLTPSDSLTPTPPTYLDDYEFVPDVDNHYRVRVYDSGGALLHTYTDHITPTLDGQVWLKDIARPFLNSTIQIASAGDITRQSRTGLLTIVGRSLPVAVTDVRGGRAYELVIETSTADEATALEVTLSTGDVMYLQSPAGYPIPTGYYSVGDLSSSWRGLPPVQQPTRWWTLPLTQCAAPDPAIVGATTTWHAVVGGYATWADLADAVDTWADVAEAIAGVGDVIVE